MRVCVILAFGLLLTSAQAKEVGIASVYWENDGSAQSHHIATGARFNPHSMTAAHRTLPFGTIVRVKNLQNNIAAYIKINDRGPCLTPRCQRTMPHLKKRIIDLTPTAADAIYLPGLGMVEVTVCKKIDGLMICS